METSTREPASVRVEEDVVINRPNEDVFARLADVSHYSDWMSRRGIFKESTQCSEGPLGPGTPYIDKARMGTWRGNVVEFEPPRFEPPRHLFSKEQSRILGRPMAEASIPPTARSCTTWASPDYSESFG